MEQDKREENATNGKWLNRLPQCSQCTCRLLLSHLTTVIPSAHFVDTIPWAHLQLSHLDWLPEAKIERIRDRCFLGLQWWSRSAY
jgi:hypothetical protein